MSVYACQSKASLNGLRRVGYRTSLARHSVGLTRESVREGASREEEQVLISQGIPALDAHSDCMAGGGALRGGEIMTSPVLQ